MDQVAFQGSAKAEAFNPVRAYDPTPDMERQAAKRLQWMKEDQDSLLKNRDKLGRAMAEQDLQNIQKLNRNSDQLAKFSTSLADVLLKDRQRKLEELEAEGINMAFEDGPQQKEVEQYQTLNAKVDQADTVTQGMANELEEKQAPVEVQRQVRNLSGRRKVGYQKGQAMLLADSYPQFLAGASGSFSINLNGKEVTLATAADSAERAAVQTAMRRQFLSQFTGMNPVMLAELVFPRIRQFDAQFQQQQAEEANKVAVKEYEAERTSETLTAIQSSPNLAEGLMNLVTIRAGGDSRLLGKKRREALSDLLVLAKSGRLTSEQIVQLEGSSFTGRDGREVKFGDFYFDEMADLRKSVTESARAKVAERDLNESEQQRAFMEQVMEGTSKNGPLNNAEKNLAIENWRKQYPTSPVPANLNGLRTIEDINIDASEQQLKYLASIGGLDSEKLRKYPLELQAKYDSAAKAGDKLKEIPGGGKDEINLIKATLGQYMSETNTGADKSPSFVWAQSKAEALFRQKFQSELSAGIKTPGEAAESAGAYVRNLMWEGKSKGTGPLAWKNANTSGDGKFIATTDASSAFVGMSSMPAQSKLGMEMQPIFSKLQSNKAVWKQEKLLNDAELKQAEDYIEGRGTTIPQKLFIIADKIKGASWSDIALAQLQLAGRTPKNMPTSEKLLTSIRPEMREYLMYRPSVSKAVATFGSSEGPDPFKGLRDVIASVESNSYGGYDAMNRGGSAGGTVAHGSANSSQVFGRGLSKMTVAEVRQLQKSGQLHAAGRYQIIEKTLGGLMTGKYGAHSIRDTDLFNAQTQDKLANLLIMGRVGRFASGKGSISEAVSGLGNEWIGFRNVSQERRVQIVENFKQQYNSPSVWRDPGSLKPRLVYKIGSIGPTSTGSHADVKPVIPGTTQSDRNQRYVQGEIDQFVSIKKNGKLVPISKGTTTTDNDAAHRSRGSFGHDYAAPAGTEVFLTNGARVISSRKTEHGDALIIETPTGKRYQFLHGTST